MKKNRRRYLSFLLRSEGSRIDDKKLGLAIWQNLLSLYGEVSAADSKLYLVEYDEETGRGILQCTASSLNKIIIAAVLISSIGKSLVSFEPKKTSGTIKSLKRQMSK
ncbi:MAG: Rpp14/Pop5 family protein [Candidatus Thorarchaeota archaeon]